MNSKRLLKNLRERRRGFRKTLHGSKVIDRRIAAKARLELVDSIIDYVEGGYRRFNEDLEGTRRNAHEHAMD